MSLLILKDDKANKYVAVDMNSAFYYSQILPAYKKHTINADEIYFLAVSGSPVVTVGWWVATWRGEGRNIIWKVG